MVDPHVIATRLYACRHGTGHLLSTSCRRVLDGWLIISVHGAGPSGSICWHTSKRMLSSWPFGQDLFTATLSFHADHLS
jgi:hypothetical protein